MTVNLGPDSLPTLNGATDSSAYAYDYNPRCVKRSLTDVSLERYANETSVLTLLRDTDDIWTFETLMQGPEGKPHPRPFLLLHSYLSPRTCTAHE